MSQQLKKKKRFLCIGNESKRRYFLKGLQNPILTKKKKKKKVVLQQYSK